MTAAGKAEENLTLFSTFLTIPSTSLYTHTHRHVCAQFDLVLITKRLFEGEAALLLGLKIPVQKAFCHVALISA